MRISTQTINHGMMQSGIPTGQTTLLDYVNGNKEGASSWFAQLSNQQSTGVDQRHYKKQEKSAGELYQELEKLVSDKEDGLFAKAEKTGESKEVRAAVEKTVENYNSLLDSMKTGTSALDQFYRQSVKALIKDHKDELKAAGITEDRTGRLRIHERTLSETSLDALEKLFGPEGSVGPKLSYVASKIQSNAEANLESITAGYLANGGAAYANNLASRFDSQG